MKSAVWVVLIGLELAVPGTAADWDNCQTALGGLNMVKEMLVPGISLERLQFFNSVLLDANGKCPENGELLVYWKMLAEKVGDRRMAALAQRRLDRLPPAARPELRYDPLAPLKKEDRPDDGRVAHKWALVVGIGEFQSPHIRPLALAAKDSRDFAAFLKDADGGRFSPDRVRQLVNRDATLEGIRAGIGWLRENVKPEDMVVIYIASHGTPRENDPNGVSYIAAYDTKLDSVYATSLQMIDLVQTLTREIQARRVTLFLDTCYSGDAGRGVGRVFASARPDTEASAASAFSGALQSLRIGRGRAVITASRADEESFESSELGNGYFTYFLLRELRQEHGLRPLGTVFPAVRTRVGEAVRTNNLGRSQTPSFEFTERADSIVLGVAEQGSDAVATRRSE